MMPRHFHDLGNNHLGTTFRKTTIRTPARLHLGLLEIAPGQPYRFGGLGLMIDSFGFELTLREGLPFGVASESEEEGLIEAWSERIQKTALRWQSFRRESGSQTVDRFDLQGEISMQKASPAHFGFGSGTQLACCVATLLESQMAFQLGRKFAAEESLAAKHIWFELATQQDPQLRLQMASGRGERSNIGLAGFLNGGWVYDKGMVGEPPSSNDSDGASGSLKASSTMKTTEHFIQHPIELVHPRIDWPILIVIPKTVSTISGSREANLFQACEGAPNVHRDRMVELIEGSILPALRRSDFATLGPAIYEYGRHAGRIFSKVQFGDFRSREVFETTELLRSFGVEGVGQSSWGPAVFGLIEDPDQASFIANKLTSHSLIYQVSVAQLAKQGATIAHCT